MSRFPHRLALTSAVLAAILGSCTPNKPAPTTVSKPAPTGGAQSAVAAKAGLRAPIPDPPVGKEATIKNYWDIGRKTPFDVANFKTSKVSAAGSTQIIKATAEVRLPNADAFERIAKAKFKAAQAEDGEEYEDDVDPLAADDFSDAEEAEVLEEAPHPVSMEIVDKPAMSDEEDRSTFTDTVDGSTLTITNDQEWAEFTVASRDGSFKVRFNPDGSYDVDGTHAATEDGAVALLLAHPVVKNASHHVIGMMAARTGRIGQEQATLSAPQQCWPDCQSLRTQAVTDGQDGVATAHSLLDRLLEELLGVDE